MEGYFPAFPTDVEVDDSIKAFIFNFYNISDTRGAIDSWTGCFTEDAAVTIGNDSATGTADIYKMREGMWEKVASRKHTVKQAFPGSFNEGAEGGEPAAGQTTEFMLYGTVDYVLKTGDKASADWAGHARVRREGKAWKFVYYRVYIQR